jgi:hypothetical protein
MVTRSRTKPSRTRQIRHEVPVVPVPLAVELRTYESHLPEWLDREGQFVLIKGREAVGFYRRRESALEAGYERFDAGPFMVKKILRHEPVYQVGNIDL